MDNPAPWRETTKGLALHVRLTPKAGRDAVDGARTGADGKAELMARVRAVPEHGEANAALVKLLAKWSGIPASAMEIAAGTTSRHKTILIAGNARETASRLKQLLQSFQA